MSRSKFASITSELLARKGDAKPWQPFYPSPCVATAAEPSADPHHTDPLWSAPLGGTGANLAKRYVIKLSSSEYERLGIIAVKKNMSRQQIVRRALDEYLTGLGREFRGECTCLAGCGGSQCQDPDQIST